MAERAQRRLAAIVSADVAGYSRLIGADEEGTLATLRAHRAELIDLLIAEHGGRIVKTMGDGLLLEFPSVVNAVKCSIEVQEGMAERNASVAVGKRLRFRVGINLGDIVIEGEDIYGEGVNVAARLQEIAEPGGIAISRRVHEDVQDRLEASFEDAGEQALKNIARPVQVWRWSPAESDMPMSPALAEASLPIPDRPSIAVLPFTNLSGDPEQNYFAEGISEDIITELARFPDLMVIARNSTFTYKGRAVKVQDVSRELGVRYVLEGSVRKSGERVRITAQLVDGQSGDHIWAERYDRNLTGIFEVQDEITQTVVASVPERIETAEFVRVKRTPPDNMSAYDYLLRGKRHHHRGTPEDNAEALRLLDKAIELDPDYASAYAWKACTLGQALALGCGGDPEVLFEQDVDNARKGLSLNENDIECHRILCEIHMMQSQWDDARRHHDRAFELNPNDARIIAQRGELFTKLGQPEDGVAWVEKSMRLDPYNADSRAHLLGRALLASGRYADAIAAYKRIAVPRYDHLADMVVCFVLLDQPEDARSHAARLLQLRTDFSADDYVERSASKDADACHRLRRALLQAGLPE